MPQGEENGLQVFPFIVFPAKLEMPGTTIFQDMNTYINCRAIGSFKLWQKTHPIPTTNTVMVCFLARFWEEFRPFQSTLNKQASLPIKACCGGGRISWCVGTGRGSSWAVVYRLCSRVCVCVWAVISHSSIPLVEGLIAIEQVIF